MDNSRSSTSHGIANNSESAGWKSIRFRVMIVREVTYAVLASSPRNVIYGIADVMAWVEGFEKEVYTSANNKDDYNSNMARWITSIDTSSEICGLRPSLASSSADETFANMDWPETICHRVQRLYRMYYAIFPNWCNLAAILLGQRFSAPPNLMTAHIVKCNLLMSILENISLRLYATNGQIGPDFKERLDDMEQRVISILRPRNVSSHRHHQGPYSAYELSVQQAVPSQSRVAQENLTELPLMSPRSPCLSEQVPHQDNGNRKRKSVVSEPENPKKLMQQMAMGCSSSLKHETPGESSGVNDHGDDLDSSGLDLSLKL
ncbi:uncharacterized protein LOC129315010 isoform X2 [Prosopis cineraria]|nr:uncharacterized protein LOC129315010 isoform X2 [Prosopis cineraria]